MNYLFLAVFLIATAIHLVASWKKDKRKRNASKPFILSSLCLWYCFEAKEISPYVVAALVFCWAGDMLLMGPGIKYLLSGGILFWIGHFLYILGYSSFFTFRAIPVPVVGICAVIYLVAEVFILNQLRQFMAKSIFVPMTLYLFTNAAMNMFAIFRLYANPSISSMVTAIGAILFFISDTILFFVRFNKNSRLKSHFAVMLTYSLGEFLIILGFLL